MELQDCSLLHYVGLYVCLTVKLKNKEKKKRNTTLKTFSVIFTDCHKPETSTHRQNTH